MDPDPQKLAEYLKRNYPEAEYRSVYEAGFSGFEAHRTLCKLGVLNIVINPADVPTSGKERNYKKGTGKRKSGGDLYPGTGESGFEESDEAEGTADGEYYKDEKPDPQSSVLSWLEVPELVRELIENHGIGC